jgi:hypothetical protein
VDPFSYVCVLTSIVAGLALTRLISGLGQLLQSRGRARPYWVHTLWMVNLILGVVITWWTQYRWRHAPNWTLFLVLWLLVIPVTNYLVTVLLFPDEQEGEPIRDWRAHYYSSARLLFILLALSFAFDVVDTLLKGVEHFRSIGPLYPFTMALWITSTLVAAFNTSPRYHAGFAIFFLLYNLAMLGNNFLRLM